MLLGALYMLAFGLGTFPAMTMISFLGNSIRVGVRNRIRTAIPVFVVVIGVFFILRGLSLDIPYLSPVLPNSAATETVICH
jgi:sulfite exporter TauE/SafE